MRTSLGRLQVRVLSRQVLPGGFSLSLTRNRKRKPPVFITSGNFSKEVFIPENHAKKETVSDCSKISVKQLLSKTDQYWLIQPFSIMQPASAKRNSSLDLLGPTNLPIDKILWITQGYCFQATTFRSNNLIKDGKSNQVRNLRQLNCVTNLFAPVFQFGMNYVSKRNFYNVATTGLDDDKTKLNEFCKRLKLETGDVKKSHDTLADDRDIEWAKKIFLDEVRDNNFDLVRQLVDCLGANSTVHKLRDEVLNAKYKDKDIDRENTPLQKFFEYGNYEACKYLIDNGADIHRKNSLGMTGYDYMLLLHRRKEKQEKATDIVDELIKKEVINFHDRFEMVHQKYVKYFEYAYWGEKYGSVEEYSGWERYFDWEDVGSEKENVSFEQEFQEVCKTEKNHEGIIRAIYTDNSSFNILEYAVANNQFKMVEKILVINKELIFAKNKLKLNALHLAAVNNVSSKIFRLLCLNADIQDGLQKYLWGIDSQSKYGANAFLAAGTYGELEGMKKLLHYGYDLNRRWYLHKDDINKKYENETLITAIIRWGGDRCLHVIKWLSRHGVCLIEPNEAGYSPLQIAVKYNCYYTAKWLIMKGVFINESLLNSATKNNVSDFKGDTALHIAVRRHFKKIVTLLLENGIDNSIKNMNNETAYILSQKIKEDLSKELKSHNLRESIERECNILSNENITKELSDFNNVPFEASVASSAIIRRREMINGNYNIANVINMHGQTPMHVAAFSNNNKALAILKNSNGQHLKDNGNFYPINYAAIYGHHELLGNLANHNAAAYRRQSALHYAMAHRKNKVADKLMGKVESIHLHYGTLKGSTPLHLAARNNNAEAIQELYKKNVYLEAKNARGQTALHVAIECHHLQAVKRLVELGANLRVKDNKGNTPLHHAINHYCSWAIIQCLVDNGSDLVSMNADGKTPVALAKLLGYKPKNGTPSQHIETPWYTNEDSQQNFIEYFIDAENKIKEEVESKNKNDCGKKRQGVDSLVFQGGSAKGVAYIGALEQLVDDKIIDLEQIKKVGGASAGAITALLLGLNYKLSEIRDIAENDFVKLVCGDSDIDLFKKLKKLFDLTKKESTIYTKFMDICSRYHSLLIIPYCYLFIRTHTLRKEINRIGKNRWPKLGLYSGDGFHEKFREWIFEKTKIKNATFEDLENMKLEKDFKTIRFIALDVLSGKAEIFSYETTPKMVVADAVRCSMSIPFLFEPYIIENEAGTVKKIYVDGGVTDNYPVWLFDNSENFGKKLKTLGLRLLSPKEKMLVVQGKKQESQSVKTLFDFLKCFFEAIYSKQESDHNLRGDRERTVYISTGDYSPLDFLVDKDKLITWGKEGAKEYLNFAILRGKEGELVKDRVEEISQILKKLSKYCVLKDKVELCFNPELDFIYIKRNDDIARLIYMLFSDTEFRSKANIKFWKALQLNINHSNQDGSTALHLAVADKSANKETLEALLDNDAYVDAVDFKNNSVLDIVLDQDNQGKLSIFELLLKYKLQLCQPEKLLGFVEQFKDEIGKIKNNPFLEKNYCHFFITYVYWILQKCKSPIEAFKNFNFNIKDSDLNGNTVLHLAVQRLNKEIVDIMINIDKNSITEKNIYHDAPIDILFDAYVDNEEKDDREKIIKESIIPIFKSLVTAGARLENCRNKVKAEHVVKEIAKRLMNDDEFKKLVDIFSQAPIPGTPKTHRNDSIGPSGVRHYGTTSFSRPLVFSQSFSKGTTECFGSRQQKRGRTLLTR